MEKPGRGNVNKGQNLFGFTMPRKNNCDTRGGGWGCFLNLCTRTCVVGEEGGGVGGGGFLSSAQYCNKGCNYIYYNSHEATGKKKETKIGILNEQ